MKARPTIEIKFNVTKSTLQSNGFGVKHIVTEKVFARKNFFCNFFLHCFLPNYTDKIRESTEFRGKANCVNIN
jgi:hypothetical protein